MTGNLVWGNWSSEECNPSYQQVFLQILLVWQMLRRPSRSFHSKDGILFSYSYSNKSGLHKLHVQFPMLLAVQWCSETGNKKQLQNQTFSYLCRAHFQANSPNFVGNSLSSDSHLKVRRFPVFPVPAKWLYPTKAHSTALELSVFAQGTYWICFLQENYHHSS